MRRMLAAGALALCAIIATRGILGAHAMLLSSEPKAGSVLARSPERVRLVFSEAIDASVSGMRLVSLNAAPQDLRVGADPRDVSALIAPLPLLPAGAYSIIWRTVSADGHPVNGSLAFRVQNDTASAKTKPAVLRPLAVAKSTSATDAVGPVWFGAPVIAALLRGLALGCLMAAGGILFFMRRALVHSPRAKKDAIWLAAGALVFCVGHLFAWATNAAADHHFDMAWMQSMLGTTPGHVELARLVAIALTLWALVIARRESIALGFAAIALAVSGAIGHPAAIHSAWTIPAKALHLGAGATWLGGLLWLIIAERADIEMFAREARRVSSVALVSVVVVVFSGIIQTRFFIQSPSDLVRTTYGIAVSLKVAGALILVAFGAYHRSRVLPKLPDAEAATGLRESVRYEIGVFALVVLLGGFLAYLSPPQPATPASMASRSIDPFDSGSP